VACGCAKAKSGSQPPLVTATAATSPRRPAGRTTVAFFAVPPPEAADGEPLRFRTVREARLAAADRDGWRVEARRVSVEL